MRKLTRSLGVTGLRIVVFLQVCSVVVFAQSEVRPRKQPTVPPGWTERPFVEKNPLPRLDEVEQARGFLLFHRPAIEPVYKNTHPLPSERVHKLTGFATRGEFEPLTFSLFPAKDLLNLRVKVSDLRSDVGVIPRRNLDVRLVTYWNVRFPYWMSDGSYRNVPELLEKVEVNDVKQHECQRYWITVHVPEDAQPGIYRGWVSVTHDGMNTEVRLPVEFTVLGFHLLRDPHKHFTAYFSEPERQYRGLTAEIYAKAVENELRAMRDHGFDMVPTVVFSGDGDHIVFTQKRIELLEKMLAAGFTGPIPAVSDDFVASVLEKHEGIQRAPHWKLSRLPSDAFYARLTKELRRFRRWWSDKGWPEFILCPIDEVDPSVRTFGVKVYQAVRDAGIKTYITKSSRSQDAKAYAPYVDAWCSQAFDVPYEQAVAGDVDYWCYPNHNAGEVKDRVVMMKGGRMTYGFGFWRSGYTVLIPWHWRWVVLGSKTQFDYLRPKVSPCGVRMDERGNIVPAVYWECFREGYDDLRYIYTLEQAIEERRGCEECAGLVADSEHLLQEIWQAICVQPRYLRMGLWPSERFNEVRWEIAQKISALYRYPAVREVEAPSVLRSIETLPEVER